MSPVLYHRASEAPPRPKILNLKKVDKIVTFEAKIGTNHQIY
jgi:hypothetical protein